jgi:hypothetical protein
VQSSPRWSKEHYQPPVSDRNKELCLLKKKYSIYFESKQRYGSPRMTVELASLGSV